MKIPIREMNRRLLNLLFYAKFICLLGVVFLAREYSKTF